MYGSSVFLRDVCTVPPHQIILPASPSACYWDPGHAGVSRMIFGNLDTDDIVSVRSRYVRQELLDDGASLDAYGLPWTVHLEVVASPADEQKENRWFFGNFSMKKSKGRHKDYYVRYLPHSENKVMQFYEALPVKVNSSTEGSKVNEWSRVLPNSFVSHGKGQHL